VTGGRVRERVVPAIRELNRPWTALAIGFVTATSALAATIGPDARWLVALGRLVTHSGGVPHGVPFAAAPSAAWANVPVLGELAFHAFDAAAGPRGLLAAQLVAVALAMAVVAGDARRAGAADGGVAIALAAIVPGALLALAGIKAQLFSLVLFPVLVALLRSESRRPSRRIWLLVPLLALWSNLHGAVLVGLAATGAYLVLERARRRPGESAGVAAAALLALCLTPALAHTPRYYQAVMSSEAARRGYGLWAPLSFRSGFDLALVVVALVLLVAFLRASPRMWELAFAAVLVALTVHAARDGIWLLLFVAAPAAKTLSLRIKPHLAVVHGVGLVFAVIAVAAIVRGPLETGASSSLIRDAIRVADGRPILADPAAAEQIAAAGGRVWISNPLEAFRRADQRLYLDWLQGRPSGDAVLDRAVVAVVSTRTPSGRRLSRDERFRVVRATSSYRLLARSP
jgi:hypothetical protein